ncbi:MAG: hypothetical protein EAZ91_18175 [Cytophagales bacterium]|nr:MAG: hypothetical protein EAZ91_18175 [Cytophagales bacterium]
MNPVAIFCWFVSVVYLTIYLLFPRSPKMQFASRGILGKPLLIALNSYAFIGLLFTYSDFISPYTSVTSVLYSYSFVMKVSFTAGATLPIIAVLMMKQSHLLHRFVGLVYAGTSMRFLYLLGEALV